MQSKLDKTQFQQLGGSFAIVNATPKRQRILTLKMLSMRYGQTLRGTLVIINLNCLCENFATGNVNNLTDPASQKKA